MPAAPFNLEVALTAIDRSFQIERFSGSLPLQQAVEYGKIRSLCGHRQCRGTDIHQIVHRPVQFRFYLTQAEFKRFDAVGSAAPENPAGGLELIRQGLQSFEGNQGGEIRS